jgi:hypothetical protein
MRCIAVVSGGTTGIIQYAGQYLYTNNRIYACGWMVEDVTGTGQTTPSDFISSGVNYSGTSEYLDIEPAATNVCLQSEDFTTTWAGTATPTANTAVAPTGATTMDTIADTDSSFQSISITPQSYTSQNEVMVSCYILKDAIPKTTRFPLMRVYFTGGSLARYCDISIDTSTGELGHNQAQLTATDYGVIDEGDHWRLWCKCNDGGNANTSYYVGFYPAVGAGSSLIAYTGGTNGNIQIWGVQMEDGTNISLPTSYIPTTTATVTRAADLILIDGDATIGAVTDDYSYYAKFAIMSPDVDNVRSVAVRSTNQAATTAYDRLTVAGTGVRTGEPRYRTRQSGNVDLVGGGSHDVPLGTETIHQYASAYKVGDEMALWYDGTEATGSVTTIDNGPLIDYDCIEIGTDNTSGGGVGTSQIRFYAFNMYAPALTATQLEDASNGTLPTFGMVVGDEDWTRRRKLLEWARSGLRPFGGHKWK